MEKGVCSRGGGVAANRAMSATQLNPAGQERPQIRTRNGQERKRTLKDDLGLSFLFGTARFSD